MPDVVGTAYYIMTNVSSVYSLSILHTTTRELSDAGS